MCEKDDAISALNAEMRAARTCYRTVFENANDTMTLLSPDGVILETNKRWFDVLGYQPHEIVGRHISDFAAPGMEAANTRLFQEYVANRVERTIPVPLRHADGRIVHMEFSLSVMALDGVRTVLAIGQDVSERIRTHAALAAAEEKYRTLVDRMPDAIWSCAADGSLEFITRNVSKILGQTPEEILAEAAQDRELHIHPEDRTLVTRAFRDHVERRASFDVEYRRQRSDGKWIWVRDRVTADYELAGVRHIEGMLSDVTDRKGLEEELRQAQKMEAVGQLTGGIAHDFNNVLSTIMANSHFLISDLTANDPRREDALEIKAAADRAATLTRQLLAFSRKQVLEPTVLNLNTTIKELERLLRRLIGEDIELSVSPDAQLGATRVDPCQIEQVIMNLVVNARDAMPAGGKLLIETSNVEVDEIYAASHVTVTPGRYVMFAVTDTGCGMDEATQRRIFEPFFTTKGPGKGTGLGLSTCHGIVNQSGGYITVYSEPGYGTVFKVLLPRVDERPSIISIRPPKQHLDGEETILLIEDDPRVRAAASRVLKGYGYRVLDASNGATAVALANAHRGEVELVLSDVVMPDGNGPDVVARLRESQPDLRALFMSGYTSHAVLSNGLLEPGINLLQKPFAPEFLVKRVRQVLDAA